MLTYIKLPVKKLILCFERNPIFSFSKSQLKTPQIRIKPEFMHCFFRTFFSSKQDRSRFVGEVMNDDTATEHDRENDACQVESSNSSSPSKSPSAHMILFK